MRVCRGREWCAFPRALVRIFLAVVLGGIGHAAAQDLEITEVAAPAINCIFDADCRITVNDVVTEFSLPGTSGTGRLQARLSPPGEAGTPGVGLTEYQYRIDLRNAVGFVDIPCITSFSLDFGDVAPLDYDEDRAFEDVFVVTRGGLGSAAPVRAVKSGSVIRFFFQNLCAGGSPGNGASSYFFGLASPNPPRTVTAEIVPSTGPGVAVDTRAPQRTIAVAVPPRRIRFCLPEFPDLMVDPDAPICRCLADSAAREFRCALTSPDYFVGFRTPFPLPKKGPITLDWTMTPFSEKALALSIRTDGQSESIAARGMDRQLSLRANAPWRPVAQSQRLEVRGRREVSLDFDLRFEGTKKTVRITAVPPSANGDR